MFREPTPKIHTLSQALFAMVALLALIGAPAVFGQLGAGGVVPINQVFNYKDDAVVTIRGTVVKQVKEDEFLVRDQSGEIIVDVKRGRDFGVAVGQNIMVQGVVDIGLFREKVLRATQVSGGDTEAATSSDPAKRTDLASIRSVYLGSKDGEIVTVAGTIVRRLDHREIIIRDKSGEIIVDAQFHQFNNLPLKVGTHIIVNGEVDIYWGGPWREIEAHSVQVQEKSLELPVPSNLEVTPIADIRAMVTEGAIVTIEGTISRRIDASEFLFQDDTGSVTVQADPKMFSHHGLSEGRAYTVTGRLDIAYDGRVRILAIIITAMLPDEPPAPDDTAPTEIPISSVYYERFDGDIVTIAGSIARLIGDTDLLLQDDTGTIIVGADDPKFRAMNLKVGQFLLVTGKVLVLAEEGRELAATRILVRQRQ